MNHEFNDIHTRIVSHLEKVAVPIRKDIPDRGFLIERLIRECYVDIFNISDLDDDSKPFALVEISNVDGARELGPLSTRIREFHTHDIGKLMNISVVEFLHLPHYLVEEMIDLSVYERLADEQDRLKSKARSKKEVRDEFSGLEL